jgi:hypothetical protein
MIGEWLASKGPEVQGGLLIATKVFNRVGPGPNDWGLSRRHIQRQVEASLRRLGREAIDLYLVHEPDPTTPIDETLRALDDLVRAGKLRYPRRLQLPPPGGCARRSGAATGMRSTASSSCRTRLACSTAATSASCSRSVRQSSSATRRLARSRAAG